MKKGRRPQWRQVTFIQARAGDSQSNDQAEHRRDQGGFIFKERFCESNKGRFNKADEQRWGPGWYNLPWVSGQDLKFNFVIPKVRWLSKDPWSRYLLFPGRRTLRSLSSFLGPRTPSNTVLNSATHQHKSATSIHMPENEAYWLHLYPIHNHLKFAAC